MCLPKAVKNTMCFLAFQAQDRICDLSHGPAIFIAAHVSVTVGTEVNRRVALGIDGPGRGFYDLSAAVTAYGGDLHEVLSLHFSCCLLTGCRLSRRTHGRLQISHAFKAHDQQALLVKFQCDFTLGDTCLLYTSFPIASCGKILN